MQTFTGRDHISQAYIQTLMDTDTPSRKKKKSRLGIKCEITMV